MKRKQKEALKTAFKTAWFVAGVALLILTVFFFTKMKSSGTISDALHFSTGLYSFTVYITITLILVLAQQIIKRINEY